MYLNEKVSSSLKWKHLCELVYLVPEMRVCMSNRKPGTLSVCMYIVKEIRSS